MRSMLFAPRDGKEAQSPNNRDRNGLVIEREASFWRAYELWPIAGSNGTLRTRYW
jgi:hypothetical protein